MLLSVIRFTDILCLSKWIFWLEHLIYLIMIPPKYSLKNFSGYAGPDALSLAGFVCFYSNNGYLLFIENCCNWESGGTISNPLVHLTSGLCYNEIMFKDSELLQFGAMLECLVVKFTDLYLSSQGLQNFTEAAWLHSAFPMCFSCFHGSLLSLYFLLR